MIKNIFSKLFGQSELSYEQQKELITSRSTRDRLRVARSQQANPEILYYLANDTDPEVRRAVAGNALTPTQAHSLLLRDTDIDVRVVLAGRIAALLPQLSENKLSQVYAFAVDALGTLALDEVLKVRSALASALKEETQAPPQVVAKLARDVEREVSEPILRFCVALPDDDLIDIVGNYKEAWVLEAISNRAHMNQKLIAGIVAADNVDATLHILQNRALKMDPETLQLIVRSAPMHEAWHEPLALRPELNVDIARELIGFVSQAVMKVLSERTDYDADTRAAITNLVTRRISYATPAQKDETDEEKFTRYVEAGTLDEDVIADALAWREKTFVRHALAHRARISLETVGRIIDSNSAKSIVALFWRAGLHARLSVEAQRVLGNIQPKDVIYARGGTEYALDKAELEEQLALFGI